MIMNGTTAGAARVMARGDGVERKTSLSPSLHTRPAGQVHKLLPADDVVGKPKRDRRAVRDLRRRVGTRFNGGTIL